VNNESEISQLPVLDTAPSATAPPETSQDDNAQPPPLLQAVERPLSTHFLPGNPGYLRGAPPGELEMYYQGSRAIYAALSKDAGDYSGVLHEGRWHYSIALATGANCRPEQLGIDIYGPAGATPVKVMAAASPVQQKAGQKPIVGAKGLDASQNPATKNLAEIPLNTSIYSGTPSFVAQPTGVSGGGATVNAVPPDANEGSLGFSFGKKPRKPKRAPLPYLTGAQVNDLDRVLSEAQARGASTIEQQQIVDAFSAIAALQGELQPRDISSGAGAQHFTEWISPEIKLTASGDLARQAEKHFSGLNKQARPSGAEFYVAMGGDANASRGSTSAGSLFASAAVSAITPLLGKITGAADDPHPAGSSKSQVHNDPKPLSYIVLNGVSYPVYSHGDSAKLSAGTGLIFVLEGPNQRISGPKASASAQFEAATPGAMSDRETGRRIVPALRYTNNVTYGYDVKKLDGFEGTHVISLLEAKYNFDSMKAGRKSNADMRRAMKAFEDNPRIPVNFELPDAAKARAFDKRTKNEIGTKRPSNMTIKGR